MLELNKIYCGDCLEVMKDIDTNCVDTIISDVPYGINFMGKKWDYDVPGVEVFAEMLRVTKPGGTALIFAGSRTQHRIACNIEDAGWVLKDCIMWIYGSGFPKATDISKQLDKTNGSYVEGKETANSRSGIVGDDKNYNHSKRITECESQSDEAQLWNGWKSHGLKPAYEPIIVAMKPNDGSYSNNALKHGVSGLNIDGGRVGVDKNEKSALVDRNKSSPENYSYSTENQDYSRCHFQQGVKKRNLKESLVNSIKKGRFPANVILECICDEVIEGEAKSGGGNTKRGKSVFKGIGNNSKYFNYGDKQGKEKAVIHTNPDCPCRMLDEQSGELKSGEITKDYINRQSSSSVKIKNSKLSTTRSEANSGGASRFFYCAKASKSERNAGLEGMEEHLRNGNSGIDRGIGFCEDCNKTYNGSNDHSNCKAQRIDKPLHKSKNHHPTVKPLKLMEYLCTLTKTPTGGIVLDPFAGSGTTGVACINTDRDFILIEKEKEYIPISEKRVEYVREKTKWRLDT